AGRHHPIIERAHPGRPTAVVVEEVPARGILEALGEPSRDGPRQLDGVAGTRAEETEIGRDAAEETIVLRAPDGLIRREQPGHPRGARASGSGAPTGPPIRGSTGQAPRGSRRSRCPWSRDGGAGPEGRPRRPR